MKAKITQAGVFQSTDQGMKECPIGTILSLTSPALPAYLVGKAQIEPEQNTEQKAETAAGERVYTPRHHRRKGRS